LNAGIQGCPRLVDFASRARKIGSNPLLSHLEMFEKWRDPMFIDIAHHYYRLRLEIDAFVGAASSRDLSSKSAHESTEIAAGSRSYG